MYQIEITQQKLDFLKRIKSKNTMDPAIAAVTETNDSLPIILELEKQQQFTHLLEMLFDVSMQDANAENKEFAGIWAVEIYEPPKTRSR